MWIIVKNRLKLKKKLKTIWRSWERFILSTFHCRKWYEQKQLHANEQWWACPSYHPPGEKAVVKKSGKGKTHCISIKQLNKMRPPATVKSAKERRFWLGTNALCKIHHYQKTTELLIPKMPFLWLVWEILQREHGFHLIQAGMVLALHKAAEAYVVWLMEDTNVCIIHVKWVDYPSPGHAAGPKDKRGNHQVTSLLVHAYGKYLFGYFVILYDILWYFMIIWVGEKPWKVETATQVGCKYYWNILLF